jgi:beta-N-acetylhexosaminidase
MKVPVHAVGEGTSLHDRKVRAGQRLVIGFAGPGVDADLRALVRELRPAGFILFGRNVVEPAQVRELCRELKSLVDPHRPALCSIDQEGGRVQRVRAPATVWPPMRTVGAAGDLTAAVARALARELRAMELDLDFAPVADVDSNPRNPVIGDRSFADEAHAVARHVAAFVPALQAEGIAACAKHFPGHGDTHLDSHLDLPVVEEELPRLRSRELVPFDAAIRAGVASVMSAHVVFPALDEDLPATLSPRVIPRELRRRLGFDGVVISDDLEMKAVAGRWDVPTIVRRATEATVDVLLACKEPQLQVAAFEALVAAQEEDAAFEQASRDAVTRVERLRERVLLPRGPRPDLAVVGCPEHLALAELVRQRGA